MCIKNAISQLETSLYCLTIGLYRQAKTCLRLGLELSLGSILFSTNKLEYLEWKIGKQDIRWSKLIDVENGVLSQRFSTVFNPDLTEEVPEFNKKLELCIEVYLNLYMAIMKLGLDLVWNSFTMKI